MSNLVKLRTKHFIVISLSLIVFVGLLFIDRTSIQTSKSNSVQSSNEARNSNIILSSLDNDSQKEFQQLEEKLKNEDLPSKKSEILNQLVAISLNRNLLDYALNYQSQLVDINKDSNNLQKLGELALMAMENLNLDSAQYLTINNLAYNSFQELLKKDKENLLWVVKTAITKVKSRNSNKIMEGIRDLVEVTKKDENHFEANYYLGYFSLESNQPEKALKRFEKCLSLQPKNPDVLMGLADTYNLLNQKNQAIKYYQEALNLSKNESQKSKIKSKLELLKR